MIAMCVTRRNGNIGSLNWEIVPDVTSVDVYRLSHKTMQGLSWFPRIGAMYRLWLPIDDI
jgi:hypothetical protein